MQPTSWAGQESVIVSKGGWGGRHQLLKQQWIGQLTEEIPECTTTTGSLSLVMLHRDGESEFGDFLVLDGRRYVLAWLCALGHG